MAIKHLAALFGLAAAFGGDVRTPRPRSVTPNHNTPSGAAAAKRAARRRRNIAKHPRGAR
jgi:hypothetical protein